MPGPIVHLQNVGMLPVYLRELGGHRGSELASLLEKDPCSPYAYFGSQGPDFLVFSLKEYGTPADEFANFLFGVYDALEPLISFYEAVVEPVEQAIEDAVKAVDQVVLGGLIDQIGQTGNLLASTFVNQLAVIATKNVDLFYGFYPKIQKGEPENSWYWFDTWHYRRTGRFASEMWRLAQGDDDLMRYALGYASHIGADVAGHPFVNAIVGGPYRSHWHRHHLVENWIDAYARLTIPDSSQVKSCLRLGGRDTYVSDAISGSYYYRLCEFPGAQLPPKLTRLITKAANSVYTGPDVPPMLSATDLDTTYRLWLMWFERSTSIGTARKPTPVAPPLSAAGNLIKDFINGFPSIPGAGNSGNGGGILDIFAAIAAFIGWLVEAFVYVITWTLSHIPAILSLPISVALQTVKWLLYQVQKYVWEIYEEGRFLLVLGAYLSPEPRDFARVPFGTAFINTASAHLTGGPRPDFNKYPLKRGSHGLFGPSYHHLVYPGTPQEYPAAELAPAPFWGRPPDIVLRGFHHWNAQVEDLYWAKAPYGTGAAFTHWIDEQTWDSHQFGSIPAFSARLISDHIDNLPDFNLDADRGHGWKAWRARTPDIDAQNPVDVDYI
ncbi:MAG: zinc dependent phospholipase C family protein [Propioniciclava sp.]|uniref:zinc dependent phospholipase C family protein n=1 Tax=Propioniciclava sp. TaxID=2038686 RepID=UPI0039E5F69C